MGKFYALIQAHMDEQLYRVTESDIARRLGVQRQTVANWKDPRSLIAREHIQAVADLAGVGYDVALSALLEDIGYVTPTDESSGDVGSSSGDGGRSVAG